MTNPTQKLYLDYAATTPLHPRAVQAMQPYFTADFGNPSSIHEWGQRAEAAVETARESMAACLGCQPGEVVLTSGGTESDNLALRGMALAESKRRGARRLLISPVEHHAVAHTAVQLADLYGFELELLPVDAYGMVDPAAVEARLQPDTALVSVIYANNEIGTINPLDEIANICRARGVPLHTDAVQAAAHLPIDLSTTAVDLLAIGAHKFYGPKGVGALAVRSGSRLVPTQTGGGQEHGLRAGTHNVPYIVGMAEALRLAREEGPQRRARVTPLRDRVIGTVLEEIPDARLTGHPDQRLTNHASFVFKGVDGNALLMLLDSAGYACSSGSACKTGSPEPSEVLTAIGLTRDWALGSLRITLSHSTVPEALDAFLAALPGLVEKARRLGL